MAPTTDSIRNITRIYLEQDMTDGVVHRIGSGEAVVYSARAPDKESGNEDAAALIPFNDASAVLAVADGAGGQRDGAQASSLAVDSLRNAMEHAAKVGQELREAILNGIERANQAIATLGTGAGTTLAVAELQDRTVRPYHVGDSMILVTGQRAKLKLQTTSHSPVGYAVEAGLLDEIEAMHHEDRHLVSNIIGSVDMRIEVGSIVQLAPNDTLLLASDGLLDNLPVDEIVECIRKGKLLNIARALADSCNQRMKNLQQGHPSKPDDLTFIVFRGTS